MAEKAVTDGSTNNNMTLSTTTTPTTTSSNKVNKRKLSFMKTFTSSRQNSDSSLQQSPLNDTMSSASSTSISSHHTTPETQSPVAETIPADAEVTIHEFTSNVIYLGKVELRNPGLSEMMETVGNIYTKAKPSFKNMERSILTLNSDGIHIRTDTGNHHHHHHHSSSSSKSLNSVHNLSSSDTMRHHDLNEPECLFKARRILYCAVDKTHPKVFFFNYQYGLRAENIQLNMVVCKTTKESKELAKRLSLLFKRIQIEQHKRDKEKREDHIQNVQRVRTRSNQNITSSSTNGSKEGSCSGHYGSGGSASEWIQGLQLSMAS